MRKQRERKQLLKQKKKLRYDTKLSNNRLDKLIFQVAKIKYEQNILEKESMQKMEKINDEVHLAKEKSKADAEFYKVQKSAEANMLLLTKEYLDLKRIEAMSVNNKVRIFFKLYQNLNLFSQVYFGPDIPNMFINERDDIKDTQR